MAGKAGRSGGSRPGNPHGSRGGARPGNPSGLRGRPKQHEQIRLSVADADQLRQATGFDDLAELLMLLAASAAAQPEATRAALAALIAVAAQDERAAPH